jgi:ABC-type branched-subunit amino acid transport system substrate-binding protein
MRRGAFVGSASLALLLSACGTPTVTREGRAVPVEIAIGDDLAAARAALESRRPEDAQRRLERLLEEVPRGPRTDEALVLLGESYWQLGKTEDAIAAYRRASLQRPRGAWAAEADLRLAGIYRATGRPELARQILSSSPVDRAEADLRARIYRELKELARDAGRREEALRWLAHERRDADHEAAAARLDAECDELLSSGALSDVELERAAAQMPSGPIQDVVVLELARRAAEAGDPEAARGWISRLPERLREREEERRASLLELLEQDTVGPGAPIGVALPLSGPYGRYGWSVLHGIVLGLGIYGDDSSRFRVHVRDTAGEPEQAARAVRELRDEGAVVVLGPLRSSTTAAAAESAQSGGIPLLAFAQGEDLPSIGAWVFRLGVTRSDQVRVLVRYAVERRGLRRFAVLYPKDEFGTDYKNLFWEEVEKAGGEIVGVESYEPDAVDVQRSVRKIVGLEYLGERERDLIRERDRLLRKPVENARRLASKELANLPPYVDFDALFVPEVAQRVGLILPQLRFYDIRDVLLLGPSDWNHRALVEIAGQDAEGAVFSDAFFPDSDFPFVREFVSAYYAAYGEQPDALAAQGYDAASMMREVLSGRGSMSRAGARNALLRVQNFPGVSGVTSFDEHGGTRKNLYLLTVRNGEIVQLPEGP